MVEAQIEYSIAVIVVFLDGYALMAISLHALGIKHWKDHPFIIAPSLSMLLTTMLALMAQGIACLV